MPQPTILIIKPSSLGDIVHGLLVANMIREGWPKAAIHWVSGNVFAPIVRACPVVDEVLIFQRNAGAREFMRLIREIRQHHYDYVLDFQGLVRTGLLTLCARADKKIGRRDAREGSRYCYGQRISLPHTGRKSHAVDILAEFLPALGLPRYVAPHLPMRIPQGYTAHGPYFNPILIFPASRRPDKNWPFYPDLTIALCRNMPDNQMIWAGAETMPCPHAHGLQNFTNLTAATTLPELLALLAQARLVVGNDSGPLHLAAALGIPTLALFGPTDPSQYRPYPGDDRQNHVLQAPKGGFENLSATAVLNQILKLLPKNCF
ncbi:MAG TPA: lipopolysaccharide heptosyltransferase family protein [Desulfonatronum sp.]|nr:lipopolysaccharide heptosyltransferase family protein [Desulfonatronum sp.]